MSAWIEAVWGGLERPAEWLPALALCLALALSVWTRRRGRAVAPAPEDGGERRPEPPPLLAPVAVAAGDDAGVATVAAALASFWGNSGGARAARLEEDGRHLSWAVATLVGIARGRAGELRTTGPALAALEQGDPEPAHRVLSALAAVEPESGAALARAQAAIAFLRDPASALEPARRAVRSAPGVIEAWSLLGMVAEVADDLDTARAACEKVITLAVRPGDGEMRAAALGTLGEIHRRLGALDRAEEYFRIALTYQIGMTRPEAMVRHYRDLARLYQARGDGARASEAVAKAMALENQRVHRIGVEKP